MQRDTASSCKLKYMQTDILDKWSGVSPKEQRNDNCLFCRWAKLLDRLEKGEIDEDGLANDDKKWYSIQYLGKSKHFFAVLDRNPRMRGDTMIISRVSTPNHFTDIADPRLGKFLPTKEDIKFIGRVIQELKKLTRDKEHGKVYLMSMCEHWESREINPQWKEGQKKPNTTEHLHFHLLPRHKAMRTECLDFVPEHLFIRCQGKYNPAKLRKVKRELARGFEH